MRKAVAASPQKTTQAVLAWYASDQAAPAPNLLCSCRMHANPEPSSQGGSAQTDSTASNNAQSAPLLQCALLRTHALTASRDFSFADTSAAAAGTAGAAAGAGAAGAAASAESKAKEVKAGDDKAAEAPRVVCCDGELRAVSLTWPCLNRTRLLRLWCAAGLDAVCAVGRRHGC